MTDRKPRHPAPYTPAIVDLMVERLANVKGTLIDPFAGMGMHLHRFCGPGRRVIGYEIEQPWVDAGGTATAGLIRQGDSTKLPHRKGSVAAIFTSPCLAQEHRTLTSDLRWVPLGDVEVGDRLTAFDEAPTMNARGRTRRRQWRWAEVIRSEPRSVECLRVILSNGDEVITTPEHPWLASRYEFGGSAPEWMSSRDLLGASGLGIGKGHQAGRRQPYFVYRQLDMWTPRTSRNAGWLAGMFDGEGSLSLGTHGSPKLTMHQAVGPVLDHAELLMNEVGCTVTRFVRDDGTLTDRKMGCLYVVGGFPGLLRALGELRPMRLLAKWETLDISTRCLQPAEKPQVVAVEHAGRRDIQEIETTTGTYFGDGYAMHNCYGNRFADHHRARDNSERRSYTHDIRTMTGDAGYELDAHNAGRLHYGREYQDLHRDVYGELWRVARPGARLLLNVSDFIRGDERIPSSVWHLATCVALGWEWIDATNVPTPRMRKGKNGEKRVDGEWVLEFRKSEVPA